MSFHKLRSVIRDSNGCPKLSKSCLLTLVKHIKPIPIMCQHYSSNYSSQGRGYKNNYNSGYGKSGQQTGNSSSVHKVSNATDEINNSTVINGVENQEEGIYDQDYNEMDDIGFPTSDLT